MSMTKILELLREHPEGLTSTEIMHELDLKNAYVQIQKLRRDKLIKIARVESKAWRYTLE